MLGDQPVVVAAAQRRSRVCSGVLIGLLLMIALAALQAPRRSAIQEKMEKATPSIALHFQRDFWRCPLYQGIAGVVVTRLWV